VASNRSGGARPAEAAANPAATSATNAASGADGALVSGPVSVNGLGDFIADQASTLSEPSDGAPAAATTTATASPLGGSNVKELQVALQPEGLGQVTLKLRLTNGRLSVVIAAADPQTLAAIENERGLLVSRLGGASQPLETLVIQSQEAQPNDAGTSNAGGFETTRGGDSGASSGGRSEDARERAAFNSPSRPPERQASDGGGTGDLIV
jgi:hypothetical protein